MNGMFRNGMSAPVIHLGMPHTRIKDKMTANPKKKPGLLSLDHMVMGRLIKTKGSQNRKTPIHPIV